MLMSDKLEQNKCTYNIKDILSMYLRSKIGNIIKVQIHNQTFFFHSKTSNYLVLKIEIVNFTCSMQLH